MGFTAFFGDNPRNRLLDFLGDHPASDYTITEMADKSGVPRQTVHRLIPDLLRTGFLRETRQVGQSRLFELKTEHPVVRSVLTTDMEEARKAPAPRRLVARRA